jgi:hypothetical protein
VPTESTPPAGLSTSPGTLWPSAVSAWTGKSW